jgi:nitroreductase
MFSDLVQKRESTRRYAKCPVEREKILACIEAARVAPSACNAQPWHFIVVDDPSLCAKIASCAETKAAKLNTFVKHAPVIVVAVAEAGNFSSRLGGLLKGKKYNIMDTSIAVEHFCLQATDLGLGSCILGWFNMRKVRRLLGIPVTRKVPLMITVGYPEEEKPPRKKVRNAIGEMMSFNRYDRKKQTDNKSPRCDI